jgi:hypothetical protein
MIFNRRNIRLNLSRDLCLAGGFGLLGFRYFHSCVCVWIRMNVVGMFRFARLALFGHPDSVWMAEACSLRWG